MRDVAQRAGVSVSTVCQALRDNPAIAEATRRKVASAARALGYRPSPVGRALVGAKTHTIGLIAATLIGEGTVAGLRALTSELKDNGYVPLMTLAPDNDEDRLWALDDLVARGVDGLVLTEAVSRSPGMSERIGALALDGFPMVGRGGQFRSLGIDCVAGIGVRRQTEILRHLVGLGHRRIGLIRVTPGAVGSGAYRRFARRAGLDADERLVCDYDLSEDVAHVRERLMTLDPPPTAIVAPWDSVAAALIDDLDRAGYDVPGDVSVTGVGGDWYAAYLRVGLTTLRLDWEGANRACARMLVERIAQPDLPPRVREFEGELVVRESTAPPRAPGPDGPSGPSEGVDATRQGQRREGRGVRYPRRPRPQGRAGGP